MLVRNSFFDWWLREQQAYMALLFDIDGTLISGRHLLPGADRVFQWLREKEYPFCLLTNDGNHSREEKSVMLAKAGVNVSPEEIVSCASALQEVADEGAFTGKLFFVMGDLGTPNYAEQAGMLVTRDRAKLDECAGIIVGEGSYDWQETISAVINSLMRLPDRPLIVPNPDSYWPSGKHGEIGIGAGGKARFMATILDEMGIQVTPQYLGKPYEPIYEFSVHDMCRRFGLDRTQVDTAQILMLGDSLRSDILGANRAGLESVLLLTGITSEEQAFRAEGALVPDMVFRSLG